MPAALTLVAQRHDQVQDYLAAIRRLSKGCGRSTAHAARSFAAKLQRGGGWERLGIDEQIDAIVKARAFASWLMVTGQLTVSADILGQVDLRPGNAPRSHHRCLPRPRTTQLRAQHRRHLPPAAADPLPRRAVGQRHPASLPSAGVGHRMGGRGAGHRRGRAALRCPDHAEPAPINGQAHRT